MLSYSEQPNYFILLQASQWVGVVANEGLGSSGGDGSMAALQLHVRAPIDEAIRSAVGLVLGVCVGSEAPLLGHHDVLAASKLVRGAAQSLDGLILVYSFRAHREDNLVNGSTGYHSQGLAEGVTHSRGQPICPSTAQHFVLTDNMEGMKADSHVESIFSSHLEHVLVDDDTSSLQALRAQLLVLSAHQMHGEGEVIRRGTASANIEDGDLGIRHTSQVATLDVWLVFAISVASRRPATHLK